MTQTGVMAGGRLTDWLSLGVLASWVPADAVDDAVEAAGRQAQRRGGKLPPRVTAYLVMALALFADVILSFRVSQGCDLRRLVEDSVVNETAAA
jgi:Insertion element 4 transposase N-terminal